MRGWGIGVCLELGLEAFSVFSYIQLQLVANLAGAGNWLIFFLFFTSLNWDADFWNIDHLISDPSIFNS
jgi:hypothetical protein